MTISRRTVLSAVAAGAALTVVPAPPARAADFFVDVPAGTQFYDDITWLATNGISTGWDVGGGRREFRPLEPVRRDAMAAFLHRLIGSPPLGLAGNQFVDVWSTMAHYEAIVWIGTRGIATGWTLPGGSVAYRPLETISREAMAAFMYRLAGQPAVPTTPTAFIDLAGSPFEREIRWMEAAGISTGWDAGGGRRTYRPLEPVRRDAMAAFLHRLAADPSFLVHRATLAALPPLTTADPSFVTAITPVTGGVYLRLGWNGTRVYLVQKRLGMERFGSDQTYDQATMDKVKAFQRSVGLTDDGVVGPTTWAKLNTGWPFDTDAYQVQPQVPLSANREERTERLVQFALAQRGSRYTWGGAGPYALGYDCSGLVLQAIYAAGRDPQPINVVKHAEPTYRTSRELYAHPGLLSVPVAQRRRGDLIFYGNSSGVVHHVTIYLGDGTMMEAYGRYAGIRAVSSQYGSSYIRPYVKRVFP